MIFESYGWNYMGAPVLVRAQSILAATCPPPCAPSATGGETALRSVPRAHRVGNLPSALCPERTGQGNRPPPFAQSAHGRGTCPPPCAPGGEPAHRPLPYYVQAAVTGQGPVENCASHIAGPFAVNGLTLEIATQ